MSKPLLLLRSGSRTLDLNDQARYWLAQDFIPPAAAFASQFAEGLMANQRRGGSLVLKRATNRSLSFTVRLAGSSAGEIQRAQRDIQAMLNRAGDKSAPLYLEYSANADLPEPLWGQFGAHLRYEVVDGSCLLGDGYLVGVRRNEDVNLSISLTLRPYALGQKQRICSAAGGILEDTIGTVDGQSRGLIVPEATTNKMTNPVFGASTWSTGWTAGASVVVVQNTDEAWLLPGTSSSAQITNVNYDTWSQTINAGNTNKHSLSCYARLQDGSAISTTQVLLVYGRTVTTTYTAVGNGWYRLRAENLDGINAGTETGVLVNPGYTVFVTGFQFEEKSYCTPLAYGDLLGCAWTSTAHASTSTRSAGRCKVPVATDTIDLVQGSLRIVVRFDVANTHPNYMFFLDTRDGSHDSLSAFFSAADDKFYMGYGATLASSSAKTFSAGSCYVIHFVWGTSGMRLYVNGALDGNNATYAYVAPASNVFIGSDYNSASQIVGNIGGAMFFNTSLTAAQVLADYNEIAPLVADKKRIEGVPWLWTKDGDNILDNCDDSTHDNFALVGGICGSTAAETEFQITNSPDIGGHYLGQITYEYGDLAYALKAGQFYTDLQGSGTADSSGGETESLGIAGYMPNAGVEVARGALFDDVPIHFVLRAMRASGAVTQKVYPMVRPNSGRDTLGEPKIIALDNAMRIYYLGSLTFQFPKFLTDDQRRLLYSAYQVGGGNTWEGDFLCAIPGKMLYYFHDSSYTTTNTVSYINGNEGMANSSGMYRLIIRGDLIELEPEKANHLIHFIGDESGSGTIGATATLVVYETPRWALL